MPLIKCPMCERDISPNAINCPHCGEPMKKDSYINNTNALRCPEFSSDMTIGNQIVNWTYDAAIKGTYENTGNEVVKIPSGKVHVLLHEKGIKICGSFFIEYLRIHNSQIESITQLKGTELKDKSVIKRAIVGGILTGGVGAVVGGMSGLGSKKVESYYLIINYWDKNTLQLISLSIGCKDNYQRFINRFNNQKNQM